MAVYIIHFSEPLKHARHYVGWANDVQARLAHHRDGTGARLLDVLNILHIDYDVVRVFAGADRKFERKLKRCKNTARYCPMCNARAGEYQPRPPIE